MQKRMKQAPELQQPGADVFSTDSQANIPRLLHRWLDSIKQTGATALL